MRRQLITPLECYQILSELGTIFQTLAEHDPPISYVDLHTDNVLRAFDGRLVLIDFGSASFLLSHRRGRVGADTLRRFLDYYLLPLVEQGRARWLLIAWEQDWKLRLWREGRISLQAFLASWHALFADLNFTSQQPATSIVAPSHHS
jgi:hypothetical protein